MCTAADVQVNKTTVLKYDILRVAKGLKVKGTNTRN